MNMNTLLALVLARNRFQNLLLSPGAEAFDVANFPRLARGLQFVDAGNPQSFLQALHFLYVESADIREFQDSRRRFSTHDALEQMTAASANEVAHAGLRLALGWVRDHDWPNFARWRRMN